MIAKRTPLLADKIHIWLQKEGKRISRIIVPQISTSKNLGVLLRKAKFETPDEAVDSLDLSGWDALAGVVTDDTYDVYRQAYDDGLSVMGITDIASTKQVDDRALAWSAQRSAEVVGKKLDEDGNLIDNPDAKWAITESTRDMLRSTVQQSIDDGDSSDMLAKKIEDSAAFSDTRATTIARTELANAHIEGNMDGWTSAGVEGKQSVLGSEHDIDDECNDAADDGVIAIDEEFSNGAMSPPYHPNCVCDLLPVLSMDNEKMLKGEVGNWRKMPETEPPDDDAPERVSLKKLIAKAFDPDQPRADNGEWGSGGEGKLSKDQKNAVYQYVQGGINEDLNTALRSNEQLGFSTNIFRKELDSSMRSSTTDQILHRGISMDMAMFNSITNDEDVIVGKIIADPGFASYSKDINVAKGFATDSRLNAVVLSIKYPSGTKMIDVDKVLPTGRKYLSEKERIIARGTRIKITSAKFDVDYVLYLEGKVVK